MLHEEDVEWIEEACRPFLERRGACVEALRIVQRRQGWVSDEQLREVAALLAMSAEELEGVATFYNQIYRRPVGRHVIQVCDNVSCWLEGGERVCDAVQRAAGAGLGETSGDGRFTVLPVACLGHCHRGPALMVDEEIHTTVDSETVATLLEAYP